MLNPAIMVVRSELIFASLSDAERPHYINQSVHLEDAGLGTDLSAVDFTFENRVLIRDIGLVATLASIICHLWLYPEVLRSGRTMLESAQLIKRCSKTTDM